MQESMKGLWCKYQDLMLLDPFDLIYAEFMVLESWADEMSLYAFNGDVWAIK